MAIPLSLEVNSTQGMNTDHDIVDQPLIHVKYNVDTFLIKCMFGQFN